MDPNVDIFLTTLSSHYREYIDWADSWSASVYIFTPEPNRDVVYSNRNAYHLYGYTQVESLGQNGTKLLMEEQYYSIGDEATAKTESKQCCNGVFPVINKRGQPFMVVAANTPFFSEDELPMFRGVICISIDARDYKGPLLRNPEIPPRDFLSHLMRLRQQQQASYANDAEEFQGNNSSSVSSTGADGILVIPSQELTIDHVIGEGEYETVYQGRWRSRDVAIKVFSCDPQLRRYRYFKNEVSIMKDLKHPNVVQLIGLVFSPDDHCIVTEFLPRGSLYTQLHKNKVKFTWRRRIQIALDIAQGMRSLHRCQPPVIHCDLKSPNLLVTDNWIVKVGDFGMSCRKAEKHITRNWVGTPQWMAPETFLGASNDEKSDVYSYGVVLWELATGKIPWEGFPKHQVAQFRRDYRCLEIPKDLDPQWASIIERCWHRDPELRPTFPDIVKEFIRLWYRTSPASTSQGRPKRRKNIVGT